MNYFEENEGVLKMEKKRSIDWCLEKNIQIAGRMPLYPETRWVIVDPNGWDRKNLNKSINELITVKEFNTRFLRSTITKVKKLKKKDFR